MPTSQSKGWSGEGRGVVMHVGEGLVLVLFARLKMYFVAEGSQVKCPLFEGFVRKTLIRYWKGERVSFNWRVKEKGPPFQRCACLCLEACVRKCVCVHV